MTADIETSPDATVRPVMELKRGYHVRLRDGRWGLLLMAPVPNLVRAGYVMAPVSIEMRHTEGAQWLAGAKAYSRSPAEQGRHVQAVFASMRTRGGAA